MGIEDTKEKKCQEASAPEECKAPSDKEKLAPPKPKGNEPELPSDGHELWEWKTKYGKEAWKGIWGEGGYLLFLFILAVFGLIFNFTGRLYEVYSLAVIKPAAIIEYGIFFRCAHCILMGFLGGTIYDIKILYKSVAQGKWHEDRRIWRIATPLASMALTIVVASMMTEEILFSATPFMATVMGFFAGYFSESAIGKLYAIALVLFG